MNSRHISIEHAVAFLLHDQELTPAEDEHLVRCNECKRMMVEAAHAELDVPPND